MTASTSRSGVHRPVAARVKFRPPRLRALSLALTVAGAILLAATPTASAHVPVDPIASSYLARVGFAPAGLDAKVVDGDLQMWLRVPPRLSVVILDYAGAPYLRFSPTGVAVNQNSAMYYLNQAPFPLTPPKGLSRNTPAHWRHVSAGHSYMWHEGRLHALASVALAPGATFVGHWRVPIVLEGNRTAITGGVWHADDPSLVWFWPLVVLLACVLAAWRLHRPNLDYELARGLGLSAVAALSVATVTRELHGRPEVSVFQMIELGLVLAFAVWALHRLLFVRHGYFTYFMIAIVALWQGAELIPTLLQGFVLASGPPFLVRAAAVLSLGAGLGSLLMVFRLADLRPVSRAEADDRAELETEDEDAWELA